MFKLDTFYQRTEWIDLLNVLKMDRQEEDGLLYCSHCNEPIIKKYDCIGHHKTELTEKNVNDVMVSLNPDNIELIHFRCHNKIHKRFGYQSKKVYLVYGSPCSGKSTFINANAGVNDLVIDMDRIYTGITNNPIYVKPDTLKYCAFKIRATLLDMVKTRYGKWTNAWIVGGYPTNAERQRLIASMNCEVIFIDEGIEMCKSNLLLSGETGRNKSEWSKYIDNWFDKYTPG